MRDLTMGILCTLGVIIVVSGLIFGVCYLNRDKTVSEQTLNLPIISAEHYRAFMDTEKTVFVVEYNNIKYTLPPIHTGNVRTFYVDDTIPVKVIKYESGRINLSVNLAAVLQTNKVGSQDTQTSESI